MKSTPAEPSCSSRSCYYCSPRCARRTCPPPTPPPRRPPAAQPKRVFSGNLHSHTYYSDVSGTPERAYRHARDDAERG